MPQSTAMNKSTVL